MRPLWVGLSQSHWTAALKQNTEHGLTIDARTAVTRWKGERMDYGIAIDSVLCQTRRATEETRKEN